VFRVFFIACIGIIIQCKSHHVDVVTLADDFATLECQAIELRKERFALADSIRFTEDTLLSANGDSVVINRLSEKLKRYGERKELLVKSSLDLADVIRLRLDSLIHNELKDLERRKMFDEALKREVEERGCE
jgi:hypothetical protein